MCSNLKSKFLILLITLYQTFTVNSQTNQNYSIHKNQSEYYAKQFDITKVSIYENEIIHKKVINKECSLNNYVFGWHPYWSNNYEINYQWNLLSDISYFSYEVDPATGDPLTTNNWENANVVDLALLNDVRINLCVTLFDNHSAFFASSASQQNLIDNLLTLVQNRNAHGVNIDFELVPDSESLNYNNFLVNLATQFHEEIPGSQVSIALHAVDWNNIYDIQLLKDYIDLFIIMAYDYYWPGSDIAGPSGQLYRMNTFNYTIPRSIAYYLHEGVPKEKLLCGMPYYGYEWNTDTDEIPALTTNNGIARTISTVKNNSNGYYSNKQTDPVSMCSYYNYYSGGTWHQLWLDDEETMQYKYDIVKQFGIAGIGIWALGYDNGFSQMWQLLESNFSDCAEVPSSHRIYDSGGPYREHFDYENYTFTIAPDNYIDYLAINFEEFELEANWDSLWIYDGSDVNAPLIGGYCGTTSPGLIEASGGALTVKFYSDSWTVKQGWNAEWFCSPVKIENIDVDNIIVSPVPAENHIFISADEYQKAEIYNLEGDLLNVFFDKKTDISTLKNGLYILKIYSENSISAKKIIVKK